MFGYTGGGLNHRLLELERFAFENSSEEEVMIEAARLMVGLDPEEKDLFETQAISLVRMLAALSKSHR